MRENTINKVPLSLLALPRLAKRLLALCIDAILCALSVWLALCLRFDSWLVPQGSQWLAVVFALLLALPIFAVAGLYREIFRHAGLAAFLAVTKAVMVYGVLYTGLLALLALPGVPRSLGLLQSPLLLLAIGASRALVRYWLSGGYLSQTRRKGLPKVLIYGAGVAGKQLAAAIANSPEMRAVGFLDDNSHLQGNVLNGLRIYKPDELNDLITKFEVSAVLLAAPSASRQRRNEILELTRKAHVAVRTLPAMMD